MLIINMNSIGSDLRKPLYVVKESRHEDATNGSVSMEYGDCGDLLRLPPGVCAHRQGRLGAEYFVDHFPGNQRFTEVIPLNLIAITRLQE